MGDGFSRGWRHTASSIAALRGATGRLVPVFHLEMDLQKEFLSRNRLLGAAGLLWTVPISDRVCARARCADRLGSRALHARTGTQFPDADHRSGNDDYLRSTASPGTSASEA